MKLHTFAIALAVAGAPAVLSAQQQQPAPAQGAHARHGAWAQRGERRGGGALQALLAHRQELGLTDAQVSRLTAINQRLQSQNQPLMERTRQAYQQAGLPDFRARRQQARAQGQQGTQHQRPQLTDAQKAAFKRVREQVKPLRQQMRQNTEAAVRDAKTVLTADQQAKIQQYMKAHRHERGQGRRGHRGARGQQQPAGA